MKTIISAHRKRLALALFVLAAGFCYSCVPGREPEAVFLSSGADAADALSADSSGGAESGFPGTNDGSGFLYEEAAASAGSGGSGSAEPDESAPAGSAGSPGASSDAEKGQECYVHVCGEVVHPGVYRLAEGQRVFEAVELAGGFTDKAADAFLNLAEPVFDGMKVEVPDKERALELSAGADEQGQGFPAGADAGKVNLNTATREELMTLRGIGQAKAEDILAYRKQHGRFEKIEEIMNVPGIKEAAFQKIRDNITV